MEAEIAAGSEQILFVDDEEALIEVGEDVLAELGYEVTSRMNGGETLSLLKEDPSRFDLVITDVTMPEMTRVELAREVLDPARPAHHHMHGIQPPYECGGGQIRGHKDHRPMKPLTKKEIAKTIRKVLDG